MNSKWFKGKCKDITNHKFKNKMCTFLLTSIINVTLSKNTVSVIIDGCQLN